MVKKKVKSPILICNNILEYHLNKYIYDISSSGEPRSKFLRAQNFSETHEGGFNNYTQANLTKLLLNFKRFY